MRTIKSLLAASVLLGLPAAANAQWYVGADAGVGFNRDADTTASGVGYSGEASYDTGYVGLAQVGYSFGAPKVEFEVGYRTNDIDSISKTTGVGGDMSSLSFMVNGQYEFMQGSKWHPFVGAGIGYARLNGELKTAAFGNADDTDWQFAYQGFGGVSYDLNDNWGLKAQYRYFATLDPEFSSGTTKVETEYANQSILVGFTYKFAKPAPVVAPVPAVAPAPVVAPAPAPVVAKPAVQLQKNFMVFFDFNKSDITPEASKVITQAASAAKQGNASRIDLTGHTDRSGSDKYNLALSMKRGNAVKDALVAQGVPAAQIYVVGKGESAPLLSTQDGVREPQNRRVEIVLP